MPMDAFEQQAKIRAIYHVSLGVSDIDAARRFYATLLQPLGYKLLHEVEENGRIISLGWGLHYCELWTNLPVNGKAPNPGNGIHLAFHAPNQLAVDRFHEIAVAAGGTCNGRPGYRVDYDPGYYGTFILDPDGNKLEAMWFDRARGMVSSS